MMLRLLSLIFVLSSLHLPNSEAFFFGRRRCRSDPEAERCGFFRLAILQRDGVPGTTSCEQFCVYIVSSQLECGGCGSIDPQEPTPNPISNSPTSPLRTAIPVNVLSPLRSNVPIQSPISINEPSQIAAPVVIPISEPVSSPMQIQVPLSNPAPAFVPVSIPTPLPLPAPVPIPIILPLPVPVPIPIPIPLPVPVPVPIPLPLPVPIPLPLPVPIPLPLPVPVAIPVPLALPVRLPIPIPQPVPIPVPIPIPQPIPVPIPVPIPIPLPVPIPVPIPITLPSPGQLLPGNYNIYLDVVGVGESDRIFFTDAKSRWESIIRGDLSNISTSPLQLPPSQGCIYPSLIDDVYICSRFVSIDGPGRVLGSAGPIYFRVSNSLTVTGDMQFDSADISSLKARGNFGTVILHEMGHILGIGTLWTRTAVTGPVSSNCPYNGPRANAEYKNITGCDVVPTENTGTAGDGTFCGHWDEDCMRSELMTGFLNNGLNPLSRITIATLQDMGYSVDYSTAESYGRGDVASACRCGQRSLMDSYSAGAIHQLGTSHKSTRRRSLSQKGYQDAVDYGHAILLKRQAPTKPISFRDSADPIHEEISYIGDKVVIVFIEEEGAFFDVTVTL